MHGQAISDSVRMRHRIRIPPGMKWIQTLRNNRSICAQAPVAVIADLHGSFGHFSTHDFFDVFVRFIRIISIGT